MSIFLDQSKGLEICGWVSILVSANSSAQGEGRWWVLGIDYRVGEVITKVPHNRSPMFRAGLAIPSNVLEKFIIDTNYEG